MAAMAEDPGIALAGLLVLRVVRVPADGGGIQQQLGAGQRHQARGFRIPLVPAHQHAEAADGGVDRLEAEVARGEVELLVEARIVGDVHLAVLAGDAAVGFEDHRGVVVQAGRAALEQRADQHHAVLLGQLAQALGAGAGDAARPGRTRRPIRAGRSRRRCAVPAAAPGARRGVRLRRRAPRSPTGWRRHRRGCAPGSAQRAGWSCSWRCGTGWGAGKTLRGARIDALDVRFLGMRRKIHRVRRQSTSPSAPAGSCMVTQCRLPFCQISGRQGTWHDLAPGERLRQHGGAAWSRRPAIAIGRASARRR